MDVPSLADPVRCDEFRKDGRADVVESVQVDRSEDLGKIVHHNVEAGRISTFRRATSGGTPSFHVAATKYS
ncbi:MAG: hypothetical protein ACE5JR_09690 [Gemmatimonadota bacterium]